MYIKHNDISRIPKGRLSLEFHKAKESDIPEIKNIASQSFEHGRFHEDPRINRQLAQQRYENWIDDLIVNTDFYIFYLKDKVGGFFVGKYVSLYM
ncbi:hypothetical protein [Paenibacillus mesophilus]|uniref:hypothetical protein n=1 Tax=Paenibacillus mesophilus TaxID=2582849 RepID=UPI001EE4BA2C|nr:hypothetical protein [Paenibacillus mesophilus]